MRIAMKGWAVGPDLRLEPGKEYEVDDELGRQLVEQHQAECIDGDECPKPETASKPVKGETAELPSKAKPRHP